MVCPCSLMDRVEDSGSLDDGSNPSRGTEICEDYLQGANFNLYRVFL